MLRGVVGLGLVCALLLSAPAMAAPTIHAHRGGSVTLGVPTAPENTMPAFENAAAHGWVVELDATRTRNGMVVIHDPTLTRTTNCSGNVRDWRTEWLFQCWSDVLGSPGSESGGGIVPGTHVPLPQLQDVLAMAKRTGATLSIEIKNIPTESDFDPLMTLAFRVINAVRDSGLPPSQLIIQSFWPPNLDLVELLLPKVPTSLLTLSALNDASPLYAAVRGYEWISPQWPVKASTVSLAHTLGVRVVPFTLDTPAAVTAAAATGVDALITDDPAMAQATLGP